MATRQMTAKAVNKTFLLIAENFSVSLLARITQERSKTPIEVTKDAKQMLK